MTEQAFEENFRTYYQGLYAYAFTILRDEAMAGEVVQEVFYRVWLKRDRLEIRSSMKGYLYRAIYNACMDQLKQTNFQPLSDATSDEDADRKIAWDELQKSLQKALNQLPEQCRTIFQLSRFEGLKYQDIARHLDLSVKTVEAQMGKALRRLRVALAEFLTILIIFLWH
jgi:RNA polymerase sigma-70 factor (ECF subfamily)